MRICEYCGVESDGREKTCTQCGGPMTTVTYVVPKPPERPIPPKAGTIIVEEDEEMESEEEESGEPSEPWIIWPIMLFLVIGVIGVLLAWLAGAFDKKPSQPTDPPQFQEYYDVLHSNPDVYRFQCGDMVGEHTPGEEAINYEYDDGSRPTWEAACAFAELNQPDYQTYGVIKSCQETQNPLNQCSALGIDTPAYDTPDYRKAEFIAWIPEGTQFKWYGCVTMHTWNESIGGGFLFWTFVDGYGWIDAYQVEGGCGEKDSFASNELPPEDPPTDDLGSAYTGAQCRDRACEYTNNFPGWEDYPVYLMKDDVSWGINVHLSPEESSPIIYILAKDYPYYDNGGMPNPPQRFRIISTSGQWGRILFGYDTTGRFRTGEGWIYMPLVRKLTDSDTREYANICKCY